MSENEQPDWLAELAKGSDALRRQMESIVKAAEQLAASGPTRPLARRITRAVGAGLREFASASEPVDPDVTVTAGLATADAAAMAPTITAVGSLALPLIRFAGEVAVQQPDLIERNIGRILALVLLAIGTAGLLGVYGPAQATVGYYAGVIFGALGLAVAIWAGRK
jgi:hypothetical protein